MLPTALRFWALPLALALLTPACSSSERRAARDAGAAARILGALAVIGVVADRPARSADGTTDADRGPLDTWTPSASDLGRAPTFDPARMQAALANIDLIECRAVAPRGYGRARVTVHPAGDISQVRVDPPISAAGAKCIADELERARVPLFKGDPVSMNATWYVP